MKFFNLAVLGHLNELNLNNFYLVSQVTDLESTFDHIKDCMYSTLIPTHNLELINVSKVTNINKDPYRNYVAGKDRQGYFHVLNQHNIDEPNFCPSFVIYTKAFYQTDHYNLPLNNVQFLVETIQNAHLFDNEPNDPPPRIYPRRFYTEYEVTIKYISNFGRNI